MKKLILFLLFAVSCLAQSTSLGTINFPGTLPNWGGFTGAGTVLTPTDFNIAECRLTDGLTEFSFDGTQLGANFGVNYDGSNVDHRINSNDTLIAIARNGGNSSPIMNFSFNGTVCTGTIVYVIPAKDVAFSAQVPTGTPPTGGHPLIAYDVESAALTKYDFGETGGCTLTVPCKTVIHNFATGTCLSGISPTWNSTFIQSHNDKIFDIGFSTTGGQGTGTIIATWNDNPGKGESVYNTGSATMLGIAPSSVCGDYGSTGLVTMSGSNCPAAGTGTCGVCTGGVACPDQTTLHEVYTSPNDANPWLLFDLGSAILCTNCGSDSDWLWQPGCTNATAISFSGHHAEGYTHIAFANGSPTGQNSIMQVITGTGCNALITTPTKIAIASTSSPNNLPAVGTPHFDSHLLWQNVDPNDTNDVYLTNTNYFLVGGANNIANYAPNGVNPNAMPGTQCQNPSCQPTSNPMPGFGVNELQSIHLTNPPNNGTTTCSSAPCTILPYNRWVHCGNDVVTFIFNAQNCIAVMDPQAKIVSIGTTYLGFFGDNNNDTNLIVGGPDWTASNATYVVGNVMTPLTANTGNFTFIINSCSGTCTSAASHPTWLQVSPAPITAWTIASNVATFTTTPLVSLTLTAAGNASAGSTIYNGTIGGAGNDFAGQNFLVSNFTNGANNGVFLCTASTNTTITLSNASGVAETHAGTAKDQFITGQIVALNLFPTSTFFNGQLVTVLSGATPTQFTANFTHANGSATEAAQAQTTVVDNNMTLAGVGEQNARMDVILVCVACTSAPPPSTPPAPALGLFAVAQSNEWETLWLGR